MKQILQRLWAGIKKIFTREGRLRPCVLPLAALACVLVLIGMGAYQLEGIFRTYTYNRTELSDDPEDLGIVDMYVPGGITNIALFGIDAREDGFKGLSDSIMIITIDAEHNDIKLTSIMRDSLVEVEGYGYQKINAAYSLGGPKLAIKTLNQVFKLNIQDYATVDFVSMAEIIDMVGGIEAELTMAEVRNANMQIWEMAAVRGMEYRELTEPGLQTLNGIQAVAYARIRKTATINGTVDDAGRTERQRLVMRQLFQKALNLEISEYPTMIKALLPCMETSLSYNDIFKLAGILTNSGLTMKEARIPANETIIVYGMNVKYLGSCVYYNLDYAARMLNAFIFEDITFEEYMEQNGVDRTSWFTGELLDETKEEETEAEEEEAVEEGVEPADPSGTDEPVEEESVDQPEEQPIEEPAEEAAEQLGQEPEETEPEPTAPKASVEEETEEVSWIHY